MGIALDRKTQRSLDAISILSVYSFINKIILLRSALAQPAGNPCRHNAGQDAAFPEDCEEFFSTLRLPW
jgi:hypothetical protein